MKIKNPTDILRDLISFKTVSKTSTKEIAGYIADHLNPLGFQCAEIPSPTNKSQVNLLCSIGPENAKGLMLSGHMDVVPVYGQDWHSDPFSMIDCEDKFIGRGVTDMKGFIASTIASCYQINFKHLKSPLSFLWTFDEETGCYGSHVAGPQLKNYLKFLPSCALIGEPTEFQIYRMHAGHISIELSVKGKGAHSSNPSLGISAIKGLNQALQAVFQFENSQKLQTSMEDYFSVPYVTMNVGQISGGSAVNIVPDEASAIIGFRPLPKTDVDQFIFDLTSHIKVSCKDLQSTFNIRLLDQASAMFTKENSPLEKVLRSYANSGDSCAAQFATDGGNLSQQGIECLIYGPGSINVAHSANEWIKKEDIFTAQTQIKKIVEDFLF